MNKELIELRPIDDLQKELEVIFDLQRIWINATEVEVTCEDTAKHALSMALQSRKLESTLEKSRSEIIKPHLDYQRAVNKLVKDFQAKLEKMEKSLQEKIEGWMLSQRDNPFTACNALTVEDGSLYSKTTWDYEILDEAEVPLVYKETTIDKAAIENAVKNGKREIP